MYYFKTYGREYQFSIGVDGLIHCDVLGLSAPSVEELKPLVSAAVKKEKAAPRIPVIILDDRWSYVPKWYPGSASSKQDRNGYRWVSYKEGEVTKRRMFDSDRLYMDTADNRTKADELVAIGKETAELTQHTKEIKDSMLNVEAYERGREQEQEEEN